jgi:hypothetical protein
MLSERENETNKEKSKTPYFTIANPLNLKDNFRKEKSNAEICHFFAVCFFYVNERSVYVTNQASGYCKAGSSCKLSHSVSLVLDREHAKKEKKLEKKRKKKNRSNNPTHVQKKSKKSIDCNDVTQNVFLASNFGMLFISLKSR